MEMYFAFGSNMLEQQMSDRCQSATRLGIGELTGFRLTFNRKGSYRPLSVASVEPSLNGKDTVFGVLWEISQEDLRTMDAIEDPQAYVRISAPVLLGRVVNYAWLYISFPDGLGLAPDPEYLRVMISGALEAGLPPEYVESIERQLR